MAKKKAAPKMVVILATREHQVGWALEVETAVAGLVAPAAFGTTNRRSSAVEIELHTPDRTIRLSAKRAKITVEHKED